MCQLQCLAMERTQKTSCCPKKNYHGSGEVEKEGDSSTLRKNMGNAMLKSKVLRGSKCHWGKRKHLLTGERQGETLTWHHKKVTSESIRKERQDVNRQMWDVFTEPSILGSAVILKTFKCCELVKFPETTNQTKKGGCGEGKKRI